MEIRFYFAQILDAFKYIHKKQLMHRDIKPKNILVNNGILKIGDFGLATYFKDSKEGFNEFKGTLITMAPEVEQYIFL
jgi:serine/threonine protein kinase